MNSRSLRAQTTPVETTVIVAVDPDYPDRSFNLAVAIREEGEASEYIETLWPEIL